MFNFPNKTSDVGGFEFVNKIINTPPNETREKLFFNEYQNGNIPDFIKNYSEINIDDLTYYVLPDYLAIGNDSDFIRTPLNPLTAKKICDLYGAFLPTPKMLKQIWEKSLIKLQPNPNGPPYTEIQQSLSKLIEHENKIKNQLSNNYGKLVSGHKKDIVIVNQLLKYEQNVAIFGWFYQNGTPIQNLNCTSHSNKYHDYSHGIRLISRKIKIKNDFYDINDVLSNKNYYKLISNELISNIDQFY